MIQYFLQIYNNGYFLDTNIIPDPENVLPTLTTFEHFTVPMVFIMQSMSQHIDPWLMYTPKGDKKGQRERFERYMHEAKHEFSSRDKVHPKINRVALGSAFVKTAEEHPDTKTVDTSPKGRRTHRTSGFQKHYQHTHKASSHGIHRFPKIHLVLIEHPGLEEFQYLFEHSRLSADEIYVLPNFKSGAPKRPRLYIRQSKWDKKRTLTICYLK